MKKIFVIFSILTFFFLFFAPLKSSADVACPDPYSVSNDNCVTCPIGYQYSMHINGGYGGCQCNDPKSIQCRNGDVLTINQCTAIIKCTTGYNCITSFTAAYPDGTIPNGCCNGTTCIIDNNGNSQPAPPPTQGKTCNPALLNGKDVGGCGGNNQPNPACSQNEVCLDDTGVCGPTTGVCVPNKSGACTAPANCQTGYDCVNGYCTPSSSTPCHVCNNATRIGYYWDDAINTCTSTTDGSSLPEISESSCQSKQVCYQNYGCCNSLADCSNVTEVATIKCDTGGCHPVFCDSSGCHTALGFIPTKAEKFIPWLFALFLAFSGAIAVFLIIVAGFRFLASQGNPEALQGAREQLTAAVIGLLFVIFSFALLQLIGVNILNIFNP